MSATTDTTIPADIIADGKAVTAAMASGQPLDDETYRRIRERADRIREELRQRDGVRQIAVDLVREARDEG